MVWGYVIAVVAGILLGASVNFGATILPRTRISEETEQVPQTQGQETTNGQQPSPLRYLLVIVFLVIFSTYLHWRHGLNLLFIIQLLYMSSFTLIAVIDIEHKLVLDTVMIPAFVVALFEILLSDRVSPLNAFAGYAIAQIIVMGFYLLGELYLAVINRHRTEKVNEVAFGFGDVTLATFCGFIVGFPRVVPMLILMILVGGAIAFLFIIIRLLLGKRYEAHIALPYGPSILIAATLMLIWGKEMARLFGAA